MRCDVHRLRAGVADLGRARAAAEGIKSKIQEADAENLPFAINSFDVVLSTFGVMFTPIGIAPPPSCCVCEAEGKIGLANWTPSAIGQVFKTLGKYLPPPAGQIAGAVGLRPRLSELLATASRCAEPAVQFPLPLESISWMS